MQLEGENIREPTVILGARPDHRKRQLLASGRTYFLKFSLVKPTA